MYDNNPSVITYLYSLIFRQKIYKRLYKALRNIEIGVTSASARSVLGKHLHCFSHVSAGLTPSPVEVYKSNSSHPPNTTPAQPTASLLHPLGCANEMDPLFAIEIVIDNFIRESLTKHIFAYNEINIKKIKTVENHVKRTI